MNKLIESFTSIEMLMVVRAVVPSFGIALLGYLLGRWDKSLHQKTISNLIY
jgi:predicted permease